MSDEETVFKVGDVVSLNSGGHLRTIISVDENFLTCAWSVRGDDKSKSFPTDALKKGTEPFDLEQIVLASMELQEERRRLSGPSDGPDSAG